MKVIIEYGVMPLQQIMPERSVYMRRTLEETKQTREDLMVAGYELFREHGYEAVTQNQIAKKAGVTRGGLNWHFNGKEELYLVILNEVMGQLAALREKELQDSSPGKKKLIRFFFSIRENTAEWFNFLNAIPTSLKEKEPFKQIINRRAQNMKNAVPLLMSILDEIEQENGQKLTKDKQKMAEALFYLYQGLSYSRTGDEQKATWEQNICTYIDIIVE